MASQLFSPFALRGLTLENRIVVSPMCQYLAEDGSATDWHLMHLGQFAVGGASLVFVEATAVSRTGRITPGCLGLYSDENERVLDRVLQFCRRHGRSKLAIQLAHSGRKGSAQIPLKGGAALRPAEGAWATLAPSPLPFGPGWHTPQALDRDGLARVKAEFVEAARRAVRLGFDLIELHGAHGYLLHEFLSPLANRRDDDYGGSLENRMRFPLEVFGAVRAALPAALPLGVRVSTTDWVEGGWTVGDCIAFSKALKARGCDFIDASSGGTDPRQSILLGPGYNVANGARVRAEAGLPVIAVGMIVEPLRAEAIVADGKADLVALGRGMMYDPRWAWHAAHALGAEIAYAPQYVRAHPALRPQLYPQRDAADD